MFLFKSFYFYFLGLISNHAYEKGFLRRDHTYFGDLYALQKLVVYITLLIGIYILGVNNFL